jgi:hypothetical protein
LAVEADRAAPGAVEALAHCRSSGGWVAGHYRHVLIVESGPRWLAVQDRAAAVSPFSLVLAQYPSSWPAAGTGVSADARHLRIGELAVRLPVGVDPPATPGLMATAVQPEPDVAWAGPILAPYLEASAFGSVGGTAVQRLVRERGAAALADLARADSRARLHAAAKRLCGLGGGATPSGDDALVGFLGAWIRLAPMGKREPAQRLAAWLAAAALERTSRLAAEFYYHLARGRLSEPVEHVLGALASGEPELVRIAAAHLARYGASSGCDTLAGVDAYLRRPSRP